ncbi:hypothetical protein Pint_14301 [Pistacia integerrima]|uniref:Uncharacterized protein n=1 Tax=Pistacia integerrima TaxID=434235 RepID=A0ACC0Y682_9ROSI|nr:hypothetical protein Pint_14301 [Pistacia integerrima]
MASKTINFSSFLLLLLSLSALSQLHATQESKNGIRKISTCLSDKGYNSMALILHMTLPSLIPSDSVFNTTTFTIFSPTDKAFLSSKYPQPPLTLLRYHVTPSTFNKTLPHGSKIDTLLRGHPLMATSSHRKASINGVKIVEWDVYNDGKVIVHGVEEFFDPAFQTLRYP